MIFRAPRRLGMSDEAMEKVYAALEVKLGQQEHDRSSVSGVWIPEKARKPEHDGIHGRVCTVAWAEKTWWRTLAKCGDASASVNAQWVFTAPDGATVGDAFEPIDPQAPDGETDGVATGDGYEVPFGGACPVQGDGEVDGHPCYYRSRGKGWSLEVYPVGGDTMTAPPIFEYGEACYVWPAGGYVRPEISAENVARAVAKFRAFIASEVKQSGS